MSIRVAGIDVHKRVLMVVGVRPPAVSTDATSEILEGLRFQRRRFGATTGELRHIAAWLHGRFWVAAEDVLDYLADAVRCHRRHAAVPSLLAHPH